jgi:hypothetical protein
MRRFIENGIVRALEKKVIRPLDATNFGEVIGEGESEAEDDD